MQSQKARADTAASLQDQGRNDAATAGRAGPQQATLTQLAAQLHARPQARALTALASGLAGTPVQRRPNRTGIPDALKQGMEAHAGLSLDGVSVNYGSSLPAQFAADAVTQGESVHIAPGQEHHLPHELGHVVQQLRGRVPVTGTMDGTPVNTDPALEADADRMGAQALQRRAAPVEDGAEPVQAFRRASVAGAAAQFAKIPKAQKKISKAKKSKKPAAKKKAAKKKRTGSKSNAAAGGYKFDRPNFSSSVYKYAKFVHAVDMDLDSDPDHLDLTAMNAAVPHRLSWENMRSNVTKFLVGTMDNAAFNKWTDSFLKAGDNRIEHYEELIDDFEKKIEKLKDKNKIEKQLLATAQSNVSVNSKKIKKKQKLASTTKPTPILDPKTIEAAIEKNTNLIALYKSRVKGLTELNAHIRQQKDDIVKSRDNLVALVGGKASKNSTQDGAKELLKEMNNFHPNVPDLGPHKGVNIQVSKYLHLNVTNSGQATPTSRAIAEIDVDHLNELAVSSDKKFAPGTLGNFHDIGTFRKAFPASLTADSNLAPRNVVEHMLHLGEFVPA
ncbi:DUF4157 domain-containing protein [Azospirillum sp. 412522]|nr:DUF4157 domain-containing protein [Azospirillum sp. 412522]MBY6263630.1 DUF4157 domain-containing protein [Azospirillum sp. 412522]